MAMIRKYDNPNEALRATLGNILWITKNLDENIKEFEIHKRKEMLYELIKYKEQIAAVGIGINHDLQMFENSSEDFR